MNELFRTTLRLYKEKAADLEAVEHLRRAHDEQHLSYTEAIAAAVNAYYGKHQLNVQCFDEAQRSEIRTIVRDELVAMSASINSLLLTIGQQPMGQPQAENYEPDEPISMTSSTALAADRPSGAQTHQNPSCWCEATAWWHQLSPNTHQPTSKGVIPIQAWPLCTTWVSRGWQALWGGCRAAAPARLQGKTLP